METPERGRVAVVVEDDPDVRDLVAGVLERIGFETFTAANGLDGVAAVLEHDPIITTLDVSMPGIDGFEAARRIREQSETLIVMLTGLAEEADVVLGLGAGADEYIVKPFRPREFRARVEALLRRPRLAPEEQPQASREAASAIAAPAASAGADGEEWIVHRDLRLNPQIRVAMRGAETLDLTRTEFDLLATLMESRRRVRSKADLTLLLRGDAYVTSYYVGESDKRAVEAHMTNLRRKLGDRPADPQYIETVRGVGYRLTSETPAA